MLLFELAVIIGDGDNDVFVWLAQYTARIYITYDFIVLAWI